MLCCSGPWCKIVLFLYGPLTCKIHTVLVHPLRWCVADRSRDDVTWLPVYQECVVPFPFLPPFAPPYPLWHCQRRSELPVAMALWALFGLSDETEAGWAERRKYKEPLAIAAPSGLKRNEVIPEVQEIIEYSGCSVFSRRYSHYLLSVNTYLIIHAAPRQLATRVTVWNDLLFGELAVEACNQGNNENDLLCWKHDRTEAE